MWRLLLKFIGEQVFGKNVCQILTFFKLIFSIILINFIETIFMGDFNKDLLQKRLSTDARDLSNNYTASFSLNSLSKTQPASLKPLRHSSIIFMSLMWTNSNYSFWSFSVFNKRSFTGIRDTSFKENSRTGQSH